jgi:hypothetical protein
LSLSRYSTSPPVVRHFSVSFSTTFDAVKNSVQRHSFSFAVQPSDCLGTLAACLNASTALKRPTAIEAAHQCQAVTLKFLREKSSQITLHSVVIRTLYIPLICCIIGAILSLVKVYLFISSITKSCSSKHTAQTYMCGKKKYFLYTDGNVKLLELTSRTVTLLLYLVRATFIHLLR